MEERGWHCDIPRPVREFGLRLGDIDGSCGRESSVFVPIQRPGTLEGSEIKHLVWAVYSETVAIVGWKPTPEEAVQGRGKIQPVGNAGRGYWLWFHRVTVFRQDIAFAYDDAQRGLRPRPAIEGDK